MAESGGISRTNIVLLLVAAAALVGAIAYSQWQARDPGDAQTPTAEASADPADSLALLEAAARANPTSVDAWQALGAANFDLNRFADAAAAFEKAAKLAPQTAALWSALGEARVMASERDPMPPAALDAFRKAAAIDPKDPRTRYFLAVKRDIDGDHAGAINDWLALLADTPAGAPWEADLRRTIEQVGQIHGLEVASRLAATKPRTLTPDELPVAARAIPGPSRAEMEAASQLPKGQQDAMINSMVAGLEDKLKTNPANVDGWIMLMRSRMTLGESAKASAALKNAIAANPAAAPRLRAQAQLLGVPGAN
ncbi:MAG: tetratricopeptide repeat protein [Sphingopyxis sp.]|nr:tetratricopeptide repeat protein [Sphingopyxis sp.]